MKTRPLLMMPALWLSVTFVTNAQTPTGLEVMQAYMAQDRTDDTVVEMDMSIISERGGVRERKLTVQTKTRDDDTRLQLIRFHEPADVAGTGFLTIENPDRDDDHWLFLPALRKTRRIAGTDKQDRFLGSDFTYEDLESEKLDEHSYVLVGSEAIGGTEAWIVEAAPTDPEKIEESAYGKRQLWISKEHALILQAKYYDRDGAYVKRFLGEEVRQVPASEKWRTYRMTMEDVQEGGKTKLGITDYHIDQGVPEDRFTQRYLKRWR